MRLTFLLLFAALVVFVNCDKIRYDGHKVYRITPKTRNQDEVLLKLGKTRSYDFWTRVNKAGLPVDIMVKPEDQDAFKDEILKNGMKPDVYIEDVQKLIDDEIVAKFDGNMTWTAYYQIADIYTWMTQLILEHPNKVSVVSVGTSYEGRQVKGLVISFKPGQRAIVIEGGIHAREWISPATVTYIANEVLNNEDPTFRKIVESFEWHLFPSINPDGYAYSHSTDRMWRKSRSRYGQCFGVDHNRNWDVYWMEFGSSSEPCDQTYAGKAPFSEMETTAVSKYIASVAYKMDAYISFHSYYQLLMLPYGHTTEPLDNYNEMMQIGNKSAQALAVKYGTIYKVGNIAEIIYEASGGSIDWVKQTFQTPIVYEYELRDRGQFGFLLPPDQIIPNGEEVMDSIIGALLEAENFGYVTIDK